MKAFWGILLMCVLVLVQGLRDEGKTYLEYVNGLIEWLHQELKSGNLRQSL